MRLMTSNTTARQKRSKFIVEGAKAFAEKVLESYSEKLVPMYGRKTTVEIVDEMPGGSRGKDALGVADPAGQRLLLSRNHVEQDSMAAVKDTILHELAHLLEPLSGHNLDLRETAFELGVRDLADSSWHPMGYGLDVCWRRAKRFGVKSRSAYSREIWIENQTMLRAAGYRRRSHCGPKDTLAGLSPERVIARLAKRIRAALGNHTFGRN